MKVQGSLFREIRGIRGVCIHCCYVGWNGAEKGEIVRCEFGDIFEKGEWKIFRRGVSVRFGGIGVQNHRR